MTAGIDRLSALMERFRVRAHLFHAGPLCGLTAFDARPGRAFLHVMRRGEMAVTHRDAHLPARILVAEPSLLFYPRPLAHDFHNAPRDGADFTCATLDFEGGDAHPLVRCLPPVLVVPLARVAGMTQTLDLLFAETEAVRCGQRLLADRLFEVLVLQLLRWLMDHPGGDTPPTGLMAGLADARLARALTALHEQPGEAWTLARMAQTAGMSRSAFAEAFRRTVGETPAGYLARWRVALAQTQLLRGRPLKAIADELGYAQPSALSRVFTQTAGCSPRVWLRAART